MNWFVEICNIVGDGALLEEVLESQGYQMLKRQDGDARGQVLHHSKYEEMNDQSAIRGDAKRLSEHLVRFASVNDISMGFTVGAIQQVMVDGAIVKHVAISGSSRVSIQARATLTFVPDISLSEEQRRNIEEDAAARSLADQRARIVNRAKAALNDERVLMVMELVRIDDPSPAHLNNIVELVMDAVGGRLDAFSTRAELTRFDRSINHPEAMGIHARHAVSSHDPPPRPMNSWEAKMFAHRIGAAWLASVSKGP